MLTPASIPPPQPDPYALGPALYTGAIGLTITVLLTPVLRWTGRRARESARGWARRYFDRQVHRAMPHMVALRMSVQSRADFLAHWQRIKTERVSMQVTLVAGLAIALQRYTWSVYAGNALVLIAAWRASATARLDDDCQFALDTERLPRARAYVDRMINEHVAELEGEMRKRDAAIDGAPGSGSEAPHDLTVPQRDEPRR